MNKKTVFIKTAKGESEGANLSVDLKRVLSLIDNKSTLDELSKRAPPSLRDDLTAVLNELVAGEYIRDRDQSLAEPKIVAPKITPPKMFVPKPPAARMTDELDFTSASSSPSSAKQKEDVIARARDELEAAVAAAKAKSNAEAAAKAEAKARQDAEKAARAKAVTEANAQAEALARQKAQEEAQARARQEAAARQKAEQEAAHAKALLDVAARSKAEAEARVRAEIEAAVRAKQEAEAKAKREAEEVLRAEQEAARIKAELEAAAKARAAAEAEAARVRAELEAAKARAEAETRARQQAEAARIKAEQEAEAARIKAQQEAEAARIRAEQEAAARAKAEAARIKAEQEAAVRTRAEAEERARVEAEAKAKAEAIRIKAEQEAAGRARAGTPEMEADAKDRAAEEEAAILLAEYERQIGGGAKAEPKAPVQAPQPVVESPAFEIKLDAFRNAPEPVVQPVVKERLVETPEADRRAQAEEASRIRKSEAADEMSRLKAQADAARRKAEEDARRQAEEKALAEEQASAWAEAEQRAQVQARIEAEQAAQLATMAQAKATQKSAPRARRQPLPWGKIAFSLIVLSLLVAIVLPYVYPMQEFVSPLEQRLTAQLKQPVKIGSMSAATFPPKLQLSNITVGKAQEVKVGSVVLKFDPLSLLSEVKVIDQAELQGISIDGKQIDSQMASLKMLGGDRAYPVRRFSLQSITIVSDEIALPALSGIAEIDKQGMFSRVSLHSEDNKYGIDLQPYQGRWQLGVSLKETSLPLLPEIVFSDLSAKGELGDGEVNFSEMDGHIFNGILLGSAKLKWSKGWQLQGRLEAKLFEVKKMFPEYGVEGELYGEGSFSFGSEKLSRLGDSPRLDASFTVKRGIVSAIDMVETARLSSREHLVGGRTHFDDLIGTVQVENHITHYRQLRIVSGMLSARGMFDVYPDKRLAGSFNAEIKMREGDNLLTLYGSLREPKLRAGR